MQSHPSHNHHTSQGPHQTRAGRTCDCCGRGLGWRSRGRWGGGQLAHLGGRRWLHCLSRRGDWGLPVQYSYQDHAMRNDRKKRKKKKKGEKEENSKEGAKKRMNESKNSGDTAKIRKKTQIMDRNKMWMAIEVKNCFFPQQIGEG